MTGRQSQGIDNLFFQNAVTPSRWPHTVIVV